MKRALKILAALAVIVAFGLVLLLHHHEIVKPATGHLSCATRLLRIEGTAALVEGPEDIVVDAGRGVAYISAYNRFSVAAEVAAGGPVRTTGGIFRLKLEDLEGRGEITVKNLSAAFSSLQPFRPHGIDLYAPDGRGEVLFVINRRYLMEGGKPRIDPTIEIFDLEGETIEELGPPAATIRHPLMCRPNDLVALDNRRFLTSNDHGACTPGAQFIEQLLGWRDAYVLVVEGGRPRIVANHIGFANGLALTPMEAGRQKLLVSATRDKAVQVYDLENLLKGDGSIKPERSIDLPGSPDNFSWDEEGRLYLAVFPNIYRFAAYMRGWFGIDTTPGGIVRLDWRSDVEPGYLHIFPGKTLNGVTVAAPYGKWLIAASGFDNKLMVCERAEDA
jgi:hypothetical protein